MDLYRPPEPAATGAGLTSPSPAPMRTYSNILVPYDGTISTEYTLRMSCRIARWNDSRVLVVVPFFGRPEEKEEKEDLRLAIKLISRQEKVPMDVVFKNGRPSDAIIEVTHAEGNDLIVFGKAEMDQLEKFVIGSITARVIGATPSDMVIVPEDRLIRWNKILLCTDNSPYSDGAIENAIDYAKEFGGVVTVLYVVEFNNEFLAFSPDGVEQMSRDGWKHVREIVAYGKERGVEVVPLVREGDRHLSIVKVAEEIEAEVIFMGCRERGGFGRLLMGSVARKVAMDAGVPIFIIKR